MLWIIIVVIVIVLSVAYRLNPRTREAWRQARTEFPRLDRTISTAWIIAALGVVGIMAYLFIGLATGRADVQPGAGVPPAVIGLILVFSGAFSVGMILAFVRFLKRRKRMRSLLLRPHD